MTREATMPGRTISFVCATCGNACLKSARRQRLSPKFCSWRCRDTQKRLPLEVRFRQFIGEATESGCLPWTGYGCKAGEYGRINDLRGSGRWIKVHRLAWELAHGAIPDGLQVLHRCDNKPCVNPDHLFLGTQQANVDDMIAKGRAVYLLGEQHGNAKLTADDVRHVRACCAGGEARTSVARRMGVSESLVRKIVARQVWKHV